MRPPTRPGFLLAIAAAVVALPAVAFGALPAGTASPAAVAANSATFQDSTGEDPAAPDITSIVVSNDDAGMLSFRINVPNRPQLGQDMVVDIFVDTDSNPATGDPNIAGVDYVMELEVGEINLYRWNGETFTRGFADPSAVTLSYSYQAGITVRISAAELGNTARFRFFAIVESGNVVDPTTRRAVCPTPPCPADLAPGGWLRWLAAIAAGGSLTAVTHAANAMGRAKTGASTAGAGNPLYATGELAGAAVIAGIAVLLPVVALAALAIALVVLLRRQRRAT